MYRHPRRSPRTTHLWSSPLGSPPRSHCVRMITLINVFDYFEVCQIHSPEGQKGVVRLETQIPGIWHIAAGRVSGY